MWPPPRETLERPVYHSLAQSLMRAIDAGIVTPGTKLPPQRRLAFDLGVSVQTIGRAYEELTRLGVISGQVGRGSFVLAKPTDATMPWQRPRQGEDVVDCSMLLPVTGQIQTDHMSRVLREMARGLPQEVLFSFRPRQALRDHCDQARIWLSGCGLDLDGPERIVPTNGNTSAMLCALMTVANPGDTIVAENMGHHTLPPLTSSLGLKLQGLELDDQGILPDAFDRACRTGSVKALFVMPAGLGPTAHLMGAERRQALVQLARKHDVWIVENDAWGPLQENRLPPIATLAPERTFYFTGLSKCVLPGLRIAWLVTPGSHVHAARTRHLVTSWVATPLMAEIASRWIADGTAQELLLWQRAQLDRRRMLVTRLLQDQTHRLSAAGMHVWLPLPNPWQEDRFVAAARSAGVAVTGGARFAVEGGTHRAGVRICLGGPSEARLETAIKSLVHLVNADPAAVLPDN